MVSPRDVARRAGRVLAGPILVSLLLAACATPSTGGNQPPPAGTAAPKEGGTLRTIRSDAPVDTLDPHLTNRVSARTVSAHIFNSLIGRDAATMALAPELATAWNQPDNRTVELTLRQGVKFSNGEAFDAEAVKANIARLRSPEGGSNLAARLTAVTDVVVVAPDKVRFVLSRPEPGLLDIFTRAQMMPPAYLAASSKETLATKPIGSGPYVFRSWDTASGTITVDRNDGYWGPRPAYQQIVFRQLTEVATIQSELLSGNADIVDAISPDAFDLVKNSGTARVETIAVLNVNDIALDALGRGGDNPLTKKEVRQAVNYAVNWDAILKAFLGGRAARMPSPVHPSQFGYDPNVKPYPYDQARARTLLAQAGYPNGFEATVRWFGSDLNKNVIEAVASDLNKVGIRTEIQGIPAAQLGPIIQQGQAGPIFGVRQSTHVGIFDAGYSWGFFTQGAPLAYYSSQRFQDMINAANAETDPAKRKTMLSDLQKFANEEAIALFGWFPETVRGVSNKVNWKPAADDIDRYFLATPR